MEAQYTIVLFLLVVGVLLGVLYMMDSFVSMSQSGGSGKGLITQVNEGLGISKT